MPFLAEAYTAWLYILGVLYASLLILFVVVSLIASDRMLMLLLALGLNLSTATMMLLINLYYKPRFVKDWKGPKPTELSQGLLQAGIAAAGVYVIARQDFPEARLRAILIVFYVVFLLVATTSIVLNWMERNKRIGPAYTSLFASVMAVALLHAGLAELFDRNEQETLIALCVAATFGLLWFQIVGALNTIIQSPTTTEHVPDDHVVVVMAKKRRKYISLDKSVEVDPKSETVRFEDLRVKSSPVDHECESADHCVIQMTATLNWHIERKKESVERFLSFAQDPELMLKHELLSHFSRHIGRHKSEDLLHWLHYLEDRATLYLSSFDHYFGVKIISVTITRLQLKFPSEEIGVSLQLEAERLRQLDDAVRNVSARTLQHLERLSQMQTQTQTASARHD